MLSAIINKRKIRCNGCIIADSRSGEWLDCKVDTSTQIK